MPLTDVLIRNAKAKLKSYKLADMQGMHLLIKPNGGKYWRFKYRFAGKEKLLALGVYPSVSLNEARNKRDKARKLLADNIDPSLEKKKSKRLMILKNENTFKALAEEWLNNQQAGWTERHAYYVICKETLRS